MLLTRENCQSIIHSLHLLNETCTVKQHQVQRHISSSAEETIKAQISDSAAHSVWHRYELFINEASVVIISKLYEVFRFTVFLSAV